jgi:hypothetical protein
MTAPNKRTSRMLKQTASCVLSSSKSSTYPRGYASGFDSPAALLNGLFEHPEWYSPLVRNLTTRETLACTYSSPQTASHVFG